MIVVNFVDNGSDKYLINTTSKCLGRKWDNNAESIKVNKPENEKNNSCTMIVTKNGKIIDYINVGEDEILVTSNLSQYDSVEIGFSFSGQNDYVKNSEIKTFYFLEAQKPDDFVAVDPEQSANINAVIGLAFTDIVLKKGTIDTYEFKNISGDTLKEIQIKGTGGGGSGGIVKETDPTVPSHVKKITEGDIVSWSNKVSQEQLNETNSNVTYLASQKADKSYVESVTKSLAGQNEYIGSYTGDDYTSDTIQEVLSIFVTENTTPSREKRNGDIINIVNGIYGGQQWIYNGNEATWRYYIDFDNHSVIDNLTSDSAVDGLSANQGKVLNEKIEEIKTNYVKNTDIANGTNAGVVKVNTSAGYGVGILESGVLRTVSANKGQISAKASNYMPIVPATLDYSVKKALADCKLEGEDAWTDEEKLNVSELLGVLEKKTGEFPNGAIRGYVYFIDTQNNQIIKQVQIQSTPDTIPLRNPNGNFYVGKPTLIYECTNKGYVDDIKTELEGKIPTITATQLEDGSYSLTIE